MTYTENPQTDIKTHRDLAHGSRILGIAGFVIGLAYTVANGDPVAVWAGLAWAGWANWSATGLEKHAIEWEHGLDGGDEE